MTIDQIRETAACERAGDSIDPSHRLTTPLSDLQRQCAEWFKKVKRFAEAVRDPNAPGAADILAEGSPVSIDDDAMLEELVDVGETIGEAQKAARSILTARR